MKFSYKPIYYGLLLAAASPLTNTAFAQTLDEVVVTAERRQTDLQDTPIAITAVTAESIEQMGVEDLAELASFVPNLTVIPTFAYGDAVPKITLRGVGAGGFPTWGISADSAVAIYIDGMYYSRNPGSILSLAEIQQVEVLRGPQGTLFGRNTTGGAIVYHTNKASTEGFSGYVDLGIGNYNERNFKGGVNVPLNDQWAMRIAYADLQRDGQIKRGPVDYGGVNSQVGRLAFRGEVSDKLTLDFSLATTKSDTTGEAQEFVAYNVPPGTQVGRQMLALSLQLQAFGEPPIVDNDPRIVLGEGKLPYYCTVDDGNPYTIGELCDNYRHFNLDVATFKATYDLNDNIQLSSLTGYLRGGSDALVDAVYLGTWARRMWQDFESFQQEFQINFSYDRWNAVGGLIYYHEDATEGEDTWESDIRPCFTCGDDPVLEQQWYDNEVANVLAGNPIHRRRENYWQTTDSIAAFAQLTYNLTEKLDLTGGVRYTLDEKDGAIEYLPNAEFEPFYNYAYVSDGRDWDDVDWRLTAQYRFTNDFMFYATKARAYKAGIMDDASVENTIVSGNPILGFTDPEEVISTEFGVRTEWFDNRLRVNATYFDMTWGNRTGSVVVNDENGYPHFTPINQPDVTTEGIEIDMMIAITDALTLTGAYADNKARQKDNPNFVLAGNAEENWNLGLTHVYSFADGASLTTSLNYSWTGTVYTFNTEEGSEDSPNATPDYEFTSGRISYAAASGKWSLAVFGQNLLDDKISYGRWSLGAFYGGVGTDPQQEMRARPRTVGASFRYNF